MNYQLEGKSKKSNFRKFVLLTLSRADAIKEGAALTREEVSRRIEAALLCQNIIVSREDHAERGHNFHIGIFIEQGISKKTAPRILRKVFPEFEGAQLNVSYHKAWASVWNISWKRTHSHTRGGNKLYTIWRKQWKHRGHIGKCPKEIKRSSKKKRSRWMATSFWGAPDILKQIFSSYNSLKAVF